ncbi:MAG: GreA/GreB family elongation factor [Oscillospiraceae bacterium]|nr:GreA/GreB family elongation factor [Oscillospiraceae bacterium]
MNNELTKTDIEKMQAELDERRLKLMPELIEEVKRTRAFGDLSENYEYKTAKQAQNRNKSRIRYLERMIASARIIEDHSAEDEVGLYDHVELYLEDEDETEHIQVVTTVRTDPLHGLISRDSPLGRAVLGRHVGDRVTVNVNDNYSYTAVVRSLEKGSDDGSAALLQY